MSEERRPRSILFRTTKYATWGEKGPPPSVIPLDAKGIAFLATVFGKAVEDAKKKGKL